MIESDIVAPEELNYIEIWSTASKTESGDEVCSPFRSGFDLVSATELPLRYAVDAGTQYTAWAAFRVEGGHKESALDPFSPKVSFEVMSRWPSSGRVEVTVRLRADCYDKSPRVDRDQQCGELGYCDDVPAGLGHQAGRT